MTRIHHDPPALKGAEQLRYASPCAPSVWLLIAKSRLLVNIRITRRDHGLRVLVRLESRNWQIANAGTQDAYAAVPLIPMRKVRDVEALLHCLAEII